MSWYKVAGKFLKGAVLVAVADTLPTLLRYLDGAGGLSGVDWAGCFDASGLVFVKALIGGALAGGLNAYKHRGTPAA